MDADSSAVTTWEERRRVRFRVPQPFAQAYEQARPRLLVSGVNPDDPEVNRLARAHDPGIEGR